MASRLPLLHYRPPASVIPDANEAVVLRSRGSVLLGRMSPDVRAISVKETEVYSYIIGLHTLPPQAVWGRMGQFHTSNDGLGFLLIALTNRDTP